MSKDLNMSNNSIIPNLPTPTSTVNNDKNQQSQQAINNLNPKDLSNIESYESESKTKTQDQPTMNTLIEPDSDQNQNQSLEMEPDIEIPPVFARESDSDIKKSISESTDRFCDRIYESMGDSFLLSRATFLAEPKILKLYRENFLARRWSCVPRRYKPIDKNNRFETLKDWGNDKNDLTSSADMLNSQNSTNFNGQQLNIKTSLINSASFNNNRSMNLNLSMSDTVRNKFPILGIVGVSSQSNAASSSGVATDGSFPGSSSDNTQDNVPEPIDQAHISKFQIFFHICLSLMLAFFGSMLANSAGRRMIQPFLEQKGPNTNSNSTGGDSSSSDESDLSSVTMCSSYNQPTYWETIEGGDPNHDGTSAIVRNNIEKQFVYRIGNSMSASRNLLAEIPRCVDYPSSSITQSSSSTGSNLEFQFETTFYVFLAYTFQPLSDGINSLNALCATSLIGKVIVDGGWHKRAYNHFENRFLEINLALFMILILFGGALMLPEIGAYLWLLTIFIFPIIIFYNGQRIWEKTNSYIAEIDDLDLYQGQEALQNQNQIANGDNNDNGYNNLSNQNENSNTNVVQNAQVNAMTKLISFRKVKLKIPAPTYLIYLRRISLIFGALAPIYGYILLIKGTFFDERVSYDDLDHKVLSPMVFGFMFLSIIFQIQVEMNLQEVRRSEISHQQMQTLRERRRKRITTVISKAAAQLTVKGGTVQQQPSDSEENDNVGSSDDYSNDIDEQVQLQSQQQKVQQVIQSGAVMRAVKDVEKEEEKEQESEVNEEKANDNTVIVIGKLDQDQENQSNNDENENGTAVKDNLVKTIYNHKPLKDDDEEDDDDNDKDKQEEDKKPVAPVIGKPKINNFMTEDKQSEEDEEEEEAEKVVAQDANIDNNDIGANDQDNVQSTQLNLTNVDDDNDADVLPQITVTTADAAATDDTMNTVTQANDKNNSLHPDSANGNTSKDKRVKQVSIGKVSDAHSDAMKSSEADSNQQSDSSSLQGDHQAHPLSALGCTLFFVHGGFTQIGRIFLAIFISGTASNSNSNDDDDAMQSSQVAGPNSNSGSDTTEQQLESAGSSEETRDIFVFLLWNIYGVFYQLMTCQLYCTFFGGKNVMISSQATFFIQLLVEVISMMVVWKTDMIYGPLGFLSLLFTIVFFDTVRDTVLLHIFARVRRQLGRLFRCCGTSFTCFGLWRPHEIMEEDYIQELMRERDVIEEDEFTMAVNYDPTNENSNNMNNNFNSSTGVQGSDVEKTSDSMENTKSNEDIMNQEQPQEVVVNDTTVPTVAIRVSNADDLNYKFVVAKSGEQERSTSEKGSNRGDNNNDNEILNPKPSNSFTKNLSRQSQISNPIQRKSTRSHSGSILDRLSQNPTTIAAIESLKNAPVQQQQRQSQSGVSQVSAAVKIQESQKMSRASGRDSKPESRVNKKSTQSTNFSRHKTAHDAELITENQRFKEGTRRLRAYVKNHAIESIQICQWAIQNSDASMMAYCIFGSLILFEIIYRTILLRLLDPDHDLGPEGFALLGSVRRQPGPMGMPDYYGSGGSSKVEDQRLLMDQYILDMNELIQKVNSINNNDNNAAETVSNIISNSQFLSIDPTPSKGAQNLDVLSNMGYYSALDVEGEIVSRVFTYLLSGMFLWFSHTHTVSWNRERVAEAICFLLDLEAQEEAEKIDFITGEIEDVDVMRVGNKLGIDRDTMEQLNMKKLNKNMVKLESSNNAGKKKKKKIGKSNSARNINDENTAEENQKIDQQDENQVKRLSDINKVTNQDNTPLTGKVSTRIQGGILNSDSSDNMNDSQNPQTKTGSKSRANRSRGFVGIAAFVEHIEIPMQSITLPSQQSEQLQSLKPEEDENNSEEEEEEDEKHEGESNTKKQSKSQPQSQSNKKDGQQTDGSKSDKKDDDKDEDEESEKDKRVVKNSDSSKKDMPNNSKQTVAQSNTDKQKQTNSKTVTTAKGPTTSTSKKEESDDDDEEEEEEEDDDDDDDSSDSNSTADKERAKALQKHNTALNAMSSQFVTSNNNQNFGKAATQTNFWAVTNQSSSTASNAQNAQIQQQSMHPQSTAKHGLLSANTIVSGFKVGDNLMNITSAVTATVSSKTGGASGQKRKGSLLTSMVRSEALTRQGPAAARKKDGYSSRNSDSGNLGADDVDNNNQYRRSSDHERSSEVGSIIGSATARNSNASFGATGDGDKDENLNQINSKTSAQQQQTLTAKSMRSEVRSHASSHKTMFTAKSNDDVNQDDDDDDVQLKTLDLNVNDYIASAKNTFLTKSVTRTAVNAGALVGIKSTNLAGLKSSKSTGVKSMVLNFNSVSLADARSEAVAVQSVAVEGRTNKSQATILEGAGGEEQDGDGDDANNVNTGAESTIDSTGMITGDNEENQISGNNNNNMASNKKNNKKLAGFRKLGRLFRSEMGLVDVTLLDVDRSILDIDGLMAYNNNDKDMVKLSILSLDQSQVDIFLGQMIVNNILSRTWTKYTTVWIFVTAVSLTDLIRLFVHYMFKVVP